MIENRECHPSTALLGMVGVQQLTVGAAASGGMPSPKKFLGAILALLVVAGLAVGCAPTSPSMPPVDVGNMAYPDPLPQGNVSTTASLGGQPRDTGNMAYPEPVPQGVVGRSAGRARVSDLGGMGYPVPLPAGNISTTAIR